jgi:peroxiredoxin
MMVEAGFEEPWTRPTAADRSVVVARKPGYGRGADVQRSELHAAGSAGTGRRRRRRRPVWPADAGAAAGVDDRGRGRPGRGAGSSDTLVVLAFPHAGRPGESLPAGWDAIPGARGCTPQNCAFRDEHGALTNLGARVLGLSAQPLDDLREVAGRLGLAYPLVSDSGLALAGALGMPVLTVEGARMYARLTMVVRGGEIVKVFYPVFPPDRNAAEVIAWLERDARGADGRKVMA